MTELFDRYLDARRPPQLARTTYRRYHGQIVRHLEPAFGRYAFPLDRPTLVRWIEAKVRADEPTTSIARDKTIMQAVFAWSVEQGWIAQSPAARLKTPRARARVRASQARDVEPAALDIPSRDEVRDFLRAAKAAEDPLYAMWRAGFQLGLRPGELAAMSEDQIIVGPSKAYEFVGVHQKLIRGDSTPAVRDADGRIIVPRVEGELILERPKWDGYRDIELDPDDPIFEVLVEQAELMRRLAVENRWELRWGGLLFRRLPGGRQGRGGDPYAPDTLPELFHRAAARVGWPATRTPHHMRHFAASNLLRANFSSKAACKILGHKTARTFEETYAHVLREVGHGTRVSDAIAGLV